MDFKHKKNDSSTISESFQKIAFEKGWIKKEDMVKKASKIDLNSSGILSEDIVKLCSQLRNSGLTKQANEIELNFLNYKKASTDLYNFSNKSSEEMIQSAHPKTDIKNNAVFHTILEKHLKMLDAVDKMPKGKYADNKSILNGVKNALGGVEVIDLMPTTKGTAAKALIDAGSAGYAASNAAWMATTPLQAAAIGTTAVLASAVIGGLIGSEIFESNFYSKEISEAYEKVVSEMKDLSATERSKVPNLSTKFDDLQIAMNLYLSKESEVNKLVSTAMSSQNADLATVESILKSIDNIANILSDISFLSSGMSNIARDVSGIGDTSFKSKENFSTIKSLWETAIDPIKNFVSDYRDVEITSGELSKLAHLKYLSVKGFSEKVYNKYRELKSKAEQHIKQKETGTTPEDLSKSNDLLKLYDVAISKLNRIDKKIEVFKNNKNYTQLKNWTASYIKYLSEEKESFSKLENKSDFVNDYKLNFDKADKKIDSIMHKLNMSI